ncbi:MAG: glucuronate isomerase [Lentisphaeria bacterium]|nr:glucuronate isomerase [Lentisphaeria bacterium]
MFNENFLLKNDLAVKLYEAAKDLPVVDFHNHLPVKDLTEDRKYNDIAELWVMSDPYKHRAMRICGVPEQFITGNATPREKFNVWAATLPKLAGNPLYDWSRLELKRIFNIEEELTPETADVIWEKANSMLAGDDFSCRSLLKRFNTAYSAPCCALNDNVECFNNIPGNVPSLRGDDILAPTAEFVCKLAEDTRMPVNGFVPFMQAVEKRIDEFHKVNCRIADHSLDNGFVYTLCDSKTAEKLYSKAVKNEFLNADEKMLLASAILKKLAGFYSKRSWLLLLHIGAQRKTSSRLRSVAGPAGGFAAIGHTCNTEALANMLNDMEMSENGLPRTILFTLNPADHAAFAVLAGSFPGDGVRGKVQLGPAWWYCDHIYGMRDGFENSAAFGVLSQFIGMTTDSRSFLSFVRHEYFRRVFCAWLAEKALKDEMPNDEEKLVKIVKAVCFENAAEYLGGISYE